MPVKVRQQAQKRINNDHTRGADPANGDAHGRGAPRNTSLLEAPRTRREPRNKHKHTWTGTRQRADPHPQSRISTCMALRHDAAAGRVATAGTAGGALLAT
jgi:hypothetical protein